MFWGYILIGKLKKSSSLLIDPIYQNLSFQSLKNVYYIFCILFSTSSILKDTSP